VAQGQGEGTQASSVQSMPTSLQRKFAKGCNYNMKLCIRGDRNTGKSALLARLQGQPFVEEYHATEEIQVASINWSYKNTEDIVKVEVWDVVDVAKKRVKIEGLKTCEQAGESGLAPGLDAEFLDVYQGTHGVIFMLDITKAWTMDYVRKEALKVPAHIPILVLANFTDQSHHRQVTKMQIADFIENFSRPGKEAAEIRWAESSLRNGFGLKFLHRFFNVPFLTLQRQSLLRQLEVNGRDILAVQQELDVYMESEEADYQLFSDTKTANRRAAAEQAAPPPSSSIVAGQPSNMIEVRSPASIPDISYSNKAAPKTQTSPLPPSPSPQPRPPSGSQSQLPDTVDSFVPDSSDFDNFLTEAGTESQVSRAQERSLQGGESSDEEEAANPMVARFDDQVEVGSYSTANGRPGISVPDDSSDEDFAVNKKKTDLDDFLSCDAITTRVSEATNYESF